MPKTRRVSKNRTTSYRKKRRYIILAIGAVACIGELSFLVFMVWRGSIPPTQLRVELPEKSGLYPLAKFGVGWHLDLGSVAIAPDGKYFVSASREPDARMWNMETGALVRTFSGHTDWLRAIAYSPEGTEILTGSFDDTAKLWDAETGICRQTFAGHSSAVVSVAFSPDGTEVLTGSLDGSAKLWNTKDGVCLWTYRAAKDVNSVAFSPDGTRILLGSDHRAELLDAATGTRLRTFEDHTGTVYSVAYSPDGDNLLTGSEDGTAKLWDTTSGKCLQTFGHDWLRASSFVAFSPDGKTLIAEDKLVDVATGKSLFSLAPFSHTVYSGGFTTDGTKLLIGMESTANLWDISELPG